jgi:lipid-binding SYLF domain-containing protein
LEAATNRSESGLDPNIAIEAKTTKKGNDHLTKRSGTAETQEHFPADADVAPAASGKTDRKYLRMVLWACLSAAFLAGGCLASGLLSQEENPTWAVILFIAALVCAAGCMFYFYQFLREISPRPRPPFISTLH